MGGQSKRDDYVAEEAELLSCSVQRNVILV